jgi:hypothetical protein
MSKSKIVLSKDIELPKSKELKKRTDKVITINDLPMNKESKPTKREKTPEKSKKEKGVLEDV